MKRKHRDFSTVEYFDELDSIGPSVEWLDAVIVCDGTFVPDEVDAAIQSSRLDGMQEERRMFRWD